jgi:hypothetical protein
MTLVALLIGHQISHRGSCYKLDEKAAKHLSLLNLLKEIKESFNDPKLFQDFFASEFLKAKSTEQLENYVGLNTEELFF